MAITGQFEVPVTSDTGIDFTNSQSTQVAYTFSASGTWTPDKNNPSLEGCTAEGFPSLHPGVQDWYKQNLPAFGSWTKYPGKTPYALVAENKTTGTVTEVGKKATLVLKPGETLRFILNDWTWDYGNNSGSIKVSWSGVSLVSKVLQFDGERDYITLPEMNINYSGGFTVEAWVCFDSFRTYSRILDLGNGCAVDNILLYGGKESNDLYFDLRQTSQEYSLVANSALEKGTWAHVAATIDASGNSALYKNGQLLVSKQIALPINVNRTQNALGASFGWGPARDFHGKLAEIRLWNRARTQAEIQADYSKRLTGKEAGLVGYWPLNEVRVDGSALKVADLTGYFPGTVTGAVLVDDSALPVS